MTTTAGSRTDQIIERVRMIPRGCVRTYGDIYPDAPRLVGRVLATHHVGDDSGHEDIPWHRVVRADGRAPRGPQQLALLRREGVAIRNDRVALSRSRQA